MADLSVGIIGGGIAGICSAVALKESGFDVALYSDEKQYPQNSPPYASLNPKYGIASYNHNLLHFHAIRYAKEFYTKHLDRTSIAFPGLCRFINNEDLNERVKKTVQNNPFLSEEISVVRHKSEQNAIFHKTAGWVSTDRLLNLEINKSQIEIKQIQSKPTGHRLIDVNGKIIANHDVVILCNPQSINNLLGQKIICEHYSGSILQGDYQSSEKVNLSQDGYIIFDDKTFACGSSYHKNKDIKVIDQDEEEKSLEKKIGWFDDISKIQNAKKQIWTGNRFTTKQRIPYVGKVLKEVKQSHNGMEFIWRDNILINSFYGSKGFTLAPLASRIIVKMLTGDLGELDAKFLNYLNPYQNLIKGHNKKNIIGFNYA
jgi:hypothetical protein